MCFGGGQGGMQMTAAQGAADPGSLPPVGSQAPSPAPPSAGGASGATVPLPPQRPAVADAAEKRLDADVRNPQTGLPEPSSKRADPEVIRDDSRTQDAGSSPQTLAYNKRKRDQTLFS